MKHPMKHTMILVLALALFAAWAGNASAAKRPACVGAPDTYIDHFDKVRGQAKDGKVRYPYPTVYDEQQSWATPAGVLPGHGSEHIHMGRCIPNGVTLHKQMKRVDVMYVFHNLIDYTVISAGMSAICCDANAGPSQNVYVTTPAQVAKLQDGVDRSPGHTTVVNVFQSYPLKPITRNGWKEMRQNIAVVKDGPQAIFDSWILDTRWTVNIQVPGQEQAPGIGGQIALRNRSHIRFPQPGNPSVIKDDYHHSGYCGLRPGTRFGSTFGAGASQMRPGVLRKPWNDGRKRVVCLYVTDGGGSAKLMIDPNFHEHFEPGGPCRHVDSDGNCLGAWFWKPNHEFPASDPRDDDIICSSMTSCPGGGTPGASGALTPVTIPRRAINRLASGWHKLVLLSSDEGECFRNGNPCPADMRGAWSNVSVLPFKVAR